MSDQAASGERVVALIRKNSRETLRISRSQYHGYELIGFRVWAHNGTSDVPTRAGVSLRIEILPKLIRELERALADARAQGLINDRAEN